MFGNFYDKRHPRFAPHSSLVVLHNADLQRVANDKTAQAGEILLKSVSKTVLSMLDPGFQCDFNELTAEVHFWNQNLFRAWAHFFYNVESDQEYDQFFHEQFRNEIHQRLGRGANVHEHIARMEHEMRRIVAQVSPRLGLPLLNRIMRSHPRLRFVDLLQAVYGHHQSLCTKPLPQFKMALGE